MRIVFTLFISIFISVLNSGIANTFDLIDEYEIDKSVKSVKEMRNYQLVRQKKDYTCAAATLATLFNQQYGKKYSERSMIRGLLVSVKPQRRAIVKKTGFSLLEMKKVVKALGYRSAGYKLDTVEELEKANFPSIVPVVINNKPHFVVVKYIKNGHVLLSDPAWGNRSMTNYQFAKIWKKRIAFFILPKNKKLGDKNLVNLFTKKDMFPDNNAYTDQLAPDVWFQQSIDGFISDTQLSVIDPAFTEDIAQPPTIAIPASPL